MVLSLGGTGPAGDAAGDRGGDWAGREAAGVSVFPWRRQGTQYDWVASLATGRSSSRRSSWGTRARGSTGTPRTASRARARTKAWPSSGVAPVTGTTCTSPWSVRLRRTEVRSELPPLTCRKTRAPWS